MSVPRSDLVPGPQSAPPNPGGGAADPSHIQTLTDEELVRLFRAEPRAGTAAMYDRFGRVVFSVALRIVGDRHLAEEITQDVFVRCWRSAERYDPQRGSLLVWVVGIAHHVAIDELRSRRHRGRQREVLLDFDLPDQDGHNADEAALASAVQEALRALPQAQREVIELIYFGGYSRQEVAERLQSPIGTIHSRIRLGMERLRQQLAGLFGEERGASERDA